MGLSSQLAPSAIARPGVIANAAARPASPYSGQAVYQLDTNQLFFWTGSTWTLDWGIGWGLIATSSGGTSNKSFTRVTSGNISVTTTSDLASFTVTPVTGRAYEIGVTACCQKITNAGYARIYFDVGGTLTYFNTYVTGSANDYITIGGATVVTGLAASSTVIKATCEAQNTGVTVFANGGTPVIFYMKDIGPA